MLRLALTSLVLLASASAFASKARLQALGQDENGSLYIEDSRNIFLNPAEIHRTKDSANFEMGSSTAGSTPNAEGNVIYNYKNMKMGLALGREHQSTVNVAKVNATAPATFIYPQNSVEFIYGLSGDMPVGVSLFYASSESDTGQAADYPDNKAEVISLRGGLDLNRDTTLFGYFDLKQEITQATAAGAANENAIKGKTNLGVGMRKNIRSDYTVSGRLDLVGYDVEQGTSKTPVESKTLVIDSTHFIKKTQGDLVFVTVGVRWVDGKVDQPAAAQDFNEKETSLPFVIGFEKEVKPWLDLRGSVRQTVLIDGRENIDNTTLAASNAIKTKNANTTSVSAGASIKWDNLVLDATLTGQNTGAVSGTSLFSNASLNYTF